MGGISNWKNFRSLNDYSIGIELTNPGHRYGYKDYPKKQFDILILVGIRSIFKRKLDINRLRKHAKILIEIGDSGLDPRKTCEDYYFYFIPTKNG
mgnify:CR=1 FL=1